MPTKRTSMMYKKSRSSPSRERSKKMSEPEQVRASAVKIGRRLTRWTKSKTNWRLRFRRYNPSKITWVNLLAKIKARPRPSKLALSKRSRTSKTRKLHSRAASERRWPVCSKLCISSSKDNKLPRLLKAVFLRIRCLFCRVWSSRWHPKWLSSSRRCNRLSPSNSAPTRKKSWSLCNLPKTTSDVSSRSEKDDLEIVWWISRLQQHALQCSP